MKPITEFIDKIICGDCLEVMKEMPNNSVDLILTSPPYDNLRDYKGYSFDFENIAKEIYRIIKDGGVCIWVVGDATTDGSETGTSFKQVLFFKEIGFNLHDTMIFHKQSPPLTHRRYEQHFEYMFILSKGTPLTFNPITIEKFWRDKRRYRCIRREKDGTFDIGTSRNDLKEKIAGNVWSYNIGGGHNTTDNITSLHPAVFPDKLAEDHIKSWSNEGNIVLDPMVGSGTTAKMAKQLNRHFIGIEINPEYCKMAQQRVNNLPKRLDNFRVKP